MQYAIFSHARWTAGRSDVDSVPDVYSFDDYRAYLRAHYRFRKARGRGHSLRAFSRSAGLGSSNYLKLVMDGGRNLSSSMAERFAAACDLRGPDSLFFCALVAYRQAETAAERERAYRTLSSFRRFREAFPLDGAHEAYHSQWYIPAIRELAGRVDFRADPNWIAGMLMPPIAPRKAEKALTVLRELGMIADDEHGVPRPVHALVETSDRPLGQHVVTFHRTMMQRAAESIDIVPREQREIASLTLCLSEAQLACLKQELARFRRVLLHEYQTQPDAKRVVQVNFQMFPLSIEEN